MSEAAIQALRSRLQAEEIRSSLSSYVQPEARATLASIARSYDILAARWERIAQGSDDRNAVRGSRSAPR